MTTFASKPASLGAAFDEVILYQDACQRGREDGEVVQLLREGLQDAPRTQVIETIQGEFAAIDHALASLQPGELCLVLIDQVEESRRICSSAWPPPANRTAHAIGPS